MTATSGSELADYTPESLKDVVDAPVFWLRPMTGRILPRYRHALVSAGLSFHQPDEVRREMLAALAKLWTPSVFDAHKGRLEAFWAAADKHEKILAQWRAEGGKGNPPEFPVDMAEVEWIGELQGRLSDSWPKIAKMAADNRLFLEESPRVAATMVLAGWSGIDVPFAIEGGVVPMATLDAIEGALETIETAARARSIDVGPDGMAFTYLLSRTIRELNLGGSAEKNSPSPSPAPSSQNGSTTKPSKRTAGAGSTASASSKATRRA